MRIDVADVGEFIFEGDIDIFGAMMMRRMESIKVVHMVKGVHRALAGKLYDIRLLLSMMIHDDP